MVDYLSVYYITSSVWYGPIGPHSHNPASDLKANRLLQMWDSIYYKTMGNEMNSIQSSSIETMGCRIQVTNQQ